MFLRRCGGRARSGQVTLPCVSLRSCLSTHHYGFGVTTVQYGSLDARYGLGASRFALVFN